MIPWNKLLGMVAFPIWVPVNSTAFDAGLLWLIGWWFVFYAIVEFYTWVPGTGMPWRDV